MGVTFDPFMEGIGCVCPSIVMKGGEDELLDIVVVSFLLLSL